MKLKAIRGNSQFHLIVKRFLTDYDTDKYSLDSYDYMDASKIYLVDPFNNNRVTALPEWDHRCEYLDIYHINSDGEAICESELPINVVNPTVRDLRITLVSKFVDDARDAERNTPGFRDHYNLESFKRINTLDELLESIYGKLIVDKNTLYYTKP